MKIVDRQTFLALPAGTLFAKFGTPCTYDIGSLAIKDETWDNDFLYQDLVGDFVEADDDGGRQRLLDDMVAGKEARPDYNCLGRDGYFTDNQLFLVFDADDKNMLVNRLDGLTRSQFDPIQRDRDMWRKSSTTAMSMLIDAVRASGGVLRIKPSDVLARRPTDRLRQELHPATNCMILTIDSVEVD